MVSAIEFAVRDSAGGIQRGMVGSEAASNILRATPGDSISLNIARESVAGYDQVGSDLVVTLVDGHTIVISNYFADTNSGNHLYLSAGGEISEVLISPSGNGPLYADYGPVEGWDKWSPLDDLHFATSDPMPSWPWPNSPPACCNSFLDFWVGPWICSQPVPLRSRSLAATVITSLRPSILPGSC